MGAVRKHRHLTEVACNATSLQVYSHASFEKAGLHALLEVPDLPASSRLRIHASDAREIRRIGSADVGSHNEDPFSGSKYVVYNPSVFKPYGSKHSFQYEPGRPNQKTDYELIRD